MHALDGADLMAGAFDVGQQVVPAHDAGKLLLVVVMFVGRLGPFALIAGLTTGMSEQHLEYPEEHIMIG